MHPTLLLKPFFPPSSDFLPSSFFELRRDKLRSLRLCERKNLPLLPEPGSIPFIPFIPVNYIAFEETTDCRDRFAQVTARDDTVLTSLSPDSDLLNETLR